MTLRFYVVKRDDNLRVASVVEHPHLESARNAADVSNEHARPIPAPFRFTDKDRELGNERVIDRYQAVWHLHKPEVAA